MNKKIKKLQAKLGLKIRGRIIKTKDRIKEIKNKVTAPVMKQTKVLSKPVFDVSKKTWSWFDGKKTAIGAVITLGGVGMMYVPVLSFFANEVVAAGIGTIATGIGFKIKKGNKDKVVKFLIGLVKK